LRTLPRPGLRAASLLAVALALRAAAAGADPLPSWNEGPARRAIVGFVERVAREGSPDFVPPPERVAVFDNDGTLWSEQPMYVQLAFALDRVKALAPEHPEWRTKEPFASVLRGDLAGVAASGEHGLLELVIATHAGNTSEEFAAIVEGWLATARHPKLGRPSDGDFEMLEWTTAGPGPRLGLLLHHDDAAREVAYDRSSTFGRLERGLDEAPARGWTLVSMKRDWKRVFPGR
jgi:hypothetical protein